MRCCMNQADFWGLSPRVRGNLVIGPDMDVRAGSIPACAGEPMPPAPAGPASGVYPRVCGGTRGSQAHEAGNTGLSPRVRGNHPHPRRAFLVIGSIPACAGEPLHIGARMNGVRVYPRVCGGTKRARLRARLRRGLSPRVRGNP